MAEFNAMFYRMIKRTAEVILGVEENYERSMDWLERYREELEDKIMALANATSNEVPVLPKTPLRPTRSKRRAPSSLTGNGEDNAAGLYNQTTDVVHSSETTTCGKLKRNASKLAGQRITIQSQLSLRAKLRRPEGNTALCDISNKTVISNIKPEKPSKSSLKESAPPVESIPETANIKNIPHPTTKPKKVKKIKQVTDSSDTESEYCRSTRSKKPAPKSISNKSTRTKKRNQDSDVIIQEVPIPVISLDSGTDGDTQENMKEKINNRNTESESEPLPTRSTGTKPKKIKKAARNRKSKTNASKTEDASVYEDAISSINREDAIKSIVNDCSVVLENVALNCTHTIQTPNDKKNSLLSTTYVIRNDEHNSLLNTTRFIERPCTALNTTRVIPKNEDSKEIVAEKIETLNKNGTWKKAILPLENESILTDDDSFVQTTPSPRKGRKNKQMFTPNSPVRKRIAAFEQLSNEVASTRVTRTKTRNPKENIESTSQNTKYVTSVTNKQLPSTIPKSESKHRQATHANKNATVVSEKSASAVKPSKAELQSRKEDEQRKRIEKEEEVRKKKEAIIQARAEEQRKKREEKQLKAQKLREELEKEKEEKLRQQQMIKDQERKKHAEMLADIEEKRRAEAQRIKQLKLYEQHEKMKLTEEKLKKQAAAAKPPPLPVDMDDSVTESESSRKNNYVKPLWAQSHNLANDLKSQLRIPKFALVTLFQMGAQTVDLCDIFDTVDERMLKRNSSAVWRTPPRYSTLPKF